MKNSYDCSPFKINKKEKLFIDHSLKKFISSPLAEFSKETLESAREIWTDIKKAHSKIFIFAFGGTGSSSKIANALSPRKDNNIHLIDSINEDFLILLSSLKKTELKTSHSIFISKSGQTKEILFYMSFLRQIYSKKKLSLKKRITVLTRSEKSPLLKWAKREGNSVIFSKTPLPGRFSFFTLSGFLQSQAYDLDFSVNMEQHTPELIKALEFFIHQSDKKREIFLCPFDSQLRELSRWLELSWSESLFKKNAEKQPPILRNITLSDLCHAFIEELMAKKGQTVFWALSLKPSQKSRFLYEKQIKNLLKTENIPYTFTFLSLNGKNSLAGLLADLYKIFFCIGDFSKSDIYTQTWVNYLKRVN